MFSKVFFIFALAVTTWFAHMREVSVTWTRVRTTDNYIRINLTFPKTEVPGKRVRDCACLCTSDFSCSSFHFVPKAGRCMLYGFVYGKITGNEPSPGARYFRVSSADCPSRDGFVLLRRPRMCFKFYSAPTSSKYAYDNCTSFGSRLVIVDTGDKIRALDAYMSGLVSRTFIGGAREGALDGSRTNWNNTLHPFYWLNGVPVATSGEESYWVAGGPSNNNGIEGCMELFNGKWNDLKCSSNRTFICEKLLD